MPVDLVDRLDACARQMHEAYHKADLNILKGDAWPKMRYQGLLVLLEVHGAFVP